MPTAATGFGKGEAGGVGCVDGELREGKWTAAWKIDRKHKGGGETLDDIAAKRDVANTGGMQSGLQMSVKARTA